MVIRFTLFAVVYFYSLLCFAEINYYRLPVTRDGATETKLAYSFWAGEYPGPIMDVTEAITLSSYSSLEKLDVSKPCTIEKGLYHPWSEEKTSALNYFTITNIATLTAKTDSQFTFLLAIDDENFEERAQVIKAGEMITDIHGADGEWCFGRFVNSKNQSQTIDFNCAELEYNLDEFQLTNQVMPENVEQWIQVQCKEGYQAFISDLEVLKSDKVRDGEFLDYGIVSRLQ